MEPYYTDNHTTIYNKSCLDMSEMLDESVQCVVTSPPYWGLRKYDGEQIIPKWGCAYGMEPTPELYVEHTIQILREIKRVLRPDGVVFWNIGDSYWGSNQGVGTKNMTPKQTSNTGTIELVAQDKSVMSSKHDVLKAKDLCLIPERVAIAAQTDGWWVRSKIIWAKPNPMPESVRDRPTGAYETILMFTKSRKYYWDPDAVKEPLAASTVGRGPVDFGGEKGRNYKPDKSDPNCRGGNEQWGRTYDYTKSSSQGRNLRDVWTITTQSYKGAHFAVFPEKIPKRCILAATSEKGSCSKCGKPWVRQVEITRTYQSGSGKAGNKPMGKWSDDPRATGDLADDIRSGPCTESKTICWTPQCKCDAPITSCIVLDPFGGSGTTIAEAKKLNREGIMYDLSEEYCKLAINRLRQCVLELNI